MGEDKERVVSQILTPSYYQIIGGQNYLSVLAPAIDKGILYVDAKAKEPPFLKMNNDAKKPFVPWIYILKDKKFKCQLWSGIYWEYFKHALGAPPSGCQNCWKTVVRPRSLAELYVLKGIQERLQVHSKCGVHLNKDMFGLYQAVFYNRSLEDGLKRYEQVRELVNEKLSEEVSVILKRGCTKMERVFPDSPNWKVSDRQRNIEDALDKLIDFKVDLVQQPNIINKATEQLWIEEAYKVGDWTYRKFTNGVDIGVVNNTFHPQEGEGNGESIKTE